MGCHGDATIYDETTSTSSIMFQLLGKHDNIAKPRQVFDQCEIRDDLVPRH